MDINWRGKTYNFTPRILEATRDKLGAGAKVTIDKNIYAFDTESVALSDRYEPICFQLSSEQFGETLQYLPERANGLGLFLDYFIRHYSWIELDEHYSFMYAHNLVYDWVQLIKNYPDLLAITRTGIGFKEDYEIYRNSDYIVNLRKGGLFTGTAPHFTINVRVSKREWFDLMFRDTFSFFPSSLAKISKTLGLEAQKMERQSDIGLRDYRIEGDSEHKQYFEKYSKMDALATRLAAEKIRELHKISNMSRIRVSSPGFAINKLYHVIPEGTELRNGDPEQSIMQLIIDTYGGGRTGGIYHGRIENLFVFDFHSSYPASMTTLPSFAPTMEYLRVPDTETISEQELLEIIDESHCFMRISGEETDSKYPALITNIKGKLTPVYGKFENIATTGIEVSVGIRSGSLRVDKIHELVCLVEMEEPSCYPFKEFILSAYSRKEEAEKESVDYVSAKLEMNSSYGKLIESRNETPVADDVRDIILPYIEGMETDFGLMYYREYIESLSESSNENFFDRYTKMCDDIAEQFGEEEIKFANFGELSLTKLEYGRYVIPAAASLTTATSRARLLAGMKGTGALYWDTDSLFVKDYIKEEVEKQLAIATTWLPPYATPLRIGDALGELDCEIENASGYLAGTKRYYLSTKEYQSCVKKKECNEEVKKQCPKAKKCKVKRALHGIPTAPFDIASDMIESLATGKNFKYKGRPRPKGVKETKDKNELGKFSSRNYESQFHLDDRLEWVETPGGWEGNVKEITKQEAKK